jgi:hypothetical protein
MCASVAVYARHIKVNRREYSSSTRYTRAPPQCHSAGMNNARRLWPSKVAGVCCTASARNAPHTKQQLHLLQEGADLLRNRSSVQFDRFPWCLAAEARCHSGRRKPGGAKQKVPFTTLVPGCSPPQYVSMPVVWQHSNKELNRHFRVEAPARAAWLTGTHGTRRCNYRLIVA